MAKKVDSFFYLCHGTDFFLRTQSGGSCYSYEGSGILVQIIHSVRIAVGKIGRPVSSIVVALLAFKHRENKKLR